MTWAPPDNWYNLHVRSGQKWAIDWASGERLSALLDTVRTNALSAGTEQAAFSAVTGIEGNALQLCLLDITALEESTVESRDRYRLFLLSQSDIQDTD
jgi:hypothetical protein